MLPKMAEVYSGPRRMENRPSDSAPVSAGWIGAMPQPLHEKKNEVTQPVPPEQSHAPQASRPPSCSSADAPRPRKLPRFAPAEERELPELSLPTYVGAPVYTRSEGEANELCDALRGGASPLLGLDIEWKVTYASGATCRPTATLQLSTGFSAYVFHLSAMRGFPPSLAALLLDPSILKVGCCVGNDALKLRRDFGVRTHGLLELRKLAGLALPYADRPWSLTDLVARTVGMRLPKQERMSDWEAARLSAEQLTYAARDAYASRLVCVALLRRLQPTSHRPPTLPSPRPPSEAVEDEARLVECVPQSLVEVTPADPMEERRGSRRVEVPGVTGDSALQSRE